MDRRRYLALASLGIAGVAGCGADEEPEPVTDTTATTTEDGTEPTGGDDTPTDEPQGQATATPAADVAAAVGELVEGDQMSLVVEGFERDVDLGEFAQPDSGNEFVVAAIALKNTGSEYTRVSNLLQLRLRDGEGYQYDQSIATGDTQRLDAGQFAPGEVSRGDIPFEVPTDASGFELVFDFDVARFGGVERALIDLSSEAEELHRLEQDLRVDVYSPGDTVRYGDVATTLHEFRTESSLGSLAEPAEGNEYAIVDISITNETGEQQRFSTVLQMMLKDGEGYSYQEDLMATGQLDRAFDEGTPLSDGETRRGQLAYEVEQGLSTLYWVFEFSVFATGNKTFWEVG